MNPKYQKVLSDIEKAEKKKSEIEGLICTPFTGHPVEGVLLCGTHMSTKGNV